MPAGKAMNTNNNVRDPARGTTKDLFRNENLTKFIADFSFSEKTVSVESSSKYTSVAPEGLLTLNFTAAWVRPSARYIFRHSFSLTKRAE